MIYKIFVKNYIVFSSVAVGGKNNLLGATHLSHGLIAGSFSYHLSGFINFIFSSLRISLKRI